MRRVLDVRTELMRLHRGSPVSARSFRSVWIESELAAKLYVDELVDGNGQPMHLDQVGSVSGLELERDFHVWDDQLLDQQHRRFLNGVQEIRGSEA